MSRLGAPTRLVISEAELVRQAYRAMAETMNRALLGVAARLKPKLQEAVRAALLGCPEYPSLTSGRLRHELGVVDAASVIESVITAVSNSATVRSLGARVGPGGIEGGLTVELLKADYAEVLAVPGARFTSENGHPVPWLEWLTLGGAGVLVSEYSYAAIPAPNSRTGLGVMVQGGSWRLQGAAPGTSSDNWLTRALGAASVKFGELAAAELNATL